jgi:hypothetical protein
MLALLPILPAKVQPAQEKGRTGLCPVQTDQQRGDAINHSGLKREYAKGNRTRWDKVQDPGSAWMFSPALVFKLLAHDKLVERVQVGDQKNHHAS